MILVLLLSLLMLTKLRRIKLVALGFLPLLLVQNELWLARDPGLQVSAIVVLLNVGWLAMLGQFAGRYWPQWGSLSSQDLLRMKG